MGTTWRDQNFDDEDAEGVDADWLDRDPEPGEVTPFGTPPARRRVGVRRWFRRLLDRG